MLRRCGSTSSTPNPLCGRSSILLLHPEPTTGIQPPPTRVRWPLSSPCRQNSIIDFGCTLVHKHGQNDRLEINLLTDCIIDLLKKVKASVVAYVCFFSISMMHEKRLLQSTIAAISQCLLVTVNCISARKTFDLQMFDVQFSLHCITLTPSHPVTADC